MTATHAKDETKPVARSASFRCVSLAKILGGIAYPVEPFGFELLQAELPPLLPDGSRDGLTQQPGLFDEGNDCLPKELQDMHRAEQHDGNLGSGTVWPNLLFLRKWMALALGS